MLCGKINEALGYTMRALHTYLLEALGLYIVTYLLKGKVLLTNIVMFVLAAVMLDTMAPTVSQYMRFGRGFKDGMTMVGGAPGSRRSKVEKFSFI